MNAHFCLLYSKVVLIVKCIQCNGSSIIADAVNKNYAHFFFVSSFPITYDRYSIIYYSNIIIMLKKAKI